MTATRTEAAPTRPSGGRLGRFGREVISEMRKVLWPSRREMTTYTIVVMIFVVIMVTVVALLDLGLAKLVLAVFG